MSTTKENTRRVITPIARLSYPNIFKPGKAMSEGQDEKYSCELIFEPGADLIALKNAAQEALELKWPKGAPKGLRSPFRDGIENREGEEYQGRIFISARSKDRPGVVIGRNRDICTDPSEVYGGCYVKASVTAFAYDMSGNRGVSFALNNLWKIRDGEPLGGRRSAEEEFGNEEIDAEAFGDDDLI